jgi:hypothetical protein
MARIPTEEIEQLKNDMSVERLMESAGIALKKSGKDRIGQCPFHDDNAVTWANRRLALSLRSPTFTCAMLMFFLLL